MAGDGMVRMNEALTRASLEFHEGVVEWPMERVS
jgi:hypothetical protein